MAKRAPQSNTGKRKEGVDLHEVERLLDFMQKHGLEEFEYARDGFAVRLKKPSAHPDVVWSHAPAAPAEGLTSAGAAHSAAQAAHGAAVESEKGAEDLHVVKSPIVGTFYSSATPGSEPFVKLGSIVEAGQTLCIIEAMKLMNEIEADVAGEVGRIFVENGQPVEYGEPLFGIRAQGKK
jgi:acetyl-CoA carboxylase biotin carboxyl carrier protein